MMSMAAVGQEGVESLEVGARLGPQDPVQLLPDGVSVAAGQRRFEFRSQR